MGGMFHGGSVAAALVAALAMAVLPTSATATPDHGPAPQSSRLLDGRAHGRDAISLLGDHLEEAAARNDTTPKHLARVLSDDPSAWVDTQGRLFYVERDASPAPVTAAASPPAPAPYADTFHLHSRPGADRVIYLDFDGATVENTAWNTDQARVGGVDLDNGFYPGIPVSSDADLDVVQDVWARVSEDYAPFEVDVTTEDPGAAALRRSNDADTTYGVKVVVTSSDEARTRLCGSCAGLAYIGVFDKITTDARPDLYSPAWVFASSGVGVSAQGMADAASHEAGHTLGLEHQGSSLDGSYAKGNALWAPIMGAGYKGVVQWSNADFADATSNQDDLAVIATYGVQPVSDDHGDDRMTATPLRGGDGVTATGTLGTRTDQDVFRVDRGCAGTLQADVTPVALGPDLDLQLSLLAADGAAVDSSAPATSPMGSYPDARATGMDAHLSDAVTSGTYYLVVDGGGQAGSYSDYGSLGRYSLHVTGCATDPVTATAPWRPLDVTSDEVLSSWAVDLRWQPPSDDGGAPITRYVVTRDGNLLATLPADARSYRVTGLHGVTAYTFGVRAVTSVGAGAAATVTRTTSVFPPGPPTGLSAGPSSTQAGVATLTWTAPTDLNGNDASLLSYWIAQSGLDSQGRTNRTYAPAGPVTSFPVDSLVDGTTYTFQVWASSGALEGARSTAYQFTYHRPRPASATNLAVTTTDTPGEWRVSWVPPAQPPKVDLVVLRVTDTSNKLIDSENLFPTVTSTSVYDLVGGHTYSLSLVSHNNGLGDGEPATLTATYPLPPPPPPPPPPTPPGQPRIGKASSGTSGGAVTATARWSAPGNGGSPITGYRVTAYRMSATGRVVAQVAVNVPASARSRVMKLRQAKYRFAVVARNAVGTGHASARSNLVTAR